MWWKYTWATIYNKTFPTNWFSCVECVHSLYRINKQHRQSFSCFDYTTRNRVFDKSNTHLTFVVRALNKTNKLIRLNQFKRLDAIRNRRGTNNTIQPPKKLLNNLISHKCYGGPTFLFYQYQIALYVSVGKNAINYKRSKQKVKFEKKNWLLTY